VVRVGYDGEERELSSLLGTRRGVENVAGNGFPILRLQVHLLFKCMLNVYVLVPCNVMPPYFWINPVQVDFFL